MPEATTREELEEALEDARAEIREAAARREEAAGPFLEALEELVESWRPYHRAVQEEREARDAALELRRQLGRRSDGQAPGPGRIPTGPRPALRQRSRLAARLDATLTGLSERGEL